MKTKKINQKLSLNKNTVANLSGPDMVRLMGGKEDEVVAVQNTATTCNIIICSWVTEGPPPYGCLWTQIVVDSMCVICSSPKTIEAPQLAD